MSTLVFLMDKMGKNLEQDYLTSPHTPFILERSEFDYWPLAVSMPPTKVCPQCKAAVPVRRKTCERCDHVFRSKRKAECNLREKATPPPKNKMATSHVVQIDTHECFPRSKKWPTYHVAVPTGNTLASQRSIFRENHLNFSTFIRR